MLLVFFALLLVLVDFQFALALDERLAAPANRRRIGGGGSVSSSNEKLVVRSTTLTPLTTTTTTARRHYRLVVGLVRCCRLTFVSLR